MAWMWMVLWRFALAACRPFRPPREYLPEGDRRFQRPCSRDWRNAAPQHPLRGRAAKFSRPRFAVRTQTDIEIRQSGTRVLVCMAAQIAVGFAPDAKKSAHERIAFRNSKNRSGPLFCPSFRWRGDSLRNFVSASYKFAGSRNRNADFTGVKNLARQLRCHLRRALEE